MSQGTGSSPRMRGTHGLYQYDNDKRGIIPAHAGNTPFVSLIRLLYWDHPRACGEHKGGTHTDSAAPGSSPRMRGTLITVIQDTGGTGIIPAHAGNTSNTSTRRRSPGDHPRACGEHNDTDAAAVGWRGSSPRMRGTRSGSSPIQTSRWDHPRACGEHPRFLAISGRMLGSSPRMRGTP